VSLTTFDVTTISATAPAKRLVSIEQRVIVASTDQSGVRAMCACVRSDGRHFEPMLLINLRIAYM